MKLKLFVAALLIILCSTANNAFSQDIIVLKNGEEVKAKVSEIDMDAVKYKKFDNLAGPVYTLKKTEIFMIKYENGTKDVFGEQKVNETQTAVVVKTTEASTPAFATTVLTDSRDGKTYKLVELGTQTWMCENLAYKSSSGCFTYNDNESNVAKYGYLYNYEIAKKVCPTGWHLPTNSEWKKFTNYLESNIGNNKLSETSVLAIPGGFRNGFGVYSGMDNYGMWWTATWNSALNAWYMLMNFGNNKFEKRSLVKTSGFSVRCLKD